MPVPGTTFLRHFRDAYVDALGEARIQQSYGFRSYERFGIVGAASTDAPVVPTSAVAGLQTMVTRLDDRGREVGLGERMPLADALRAYTVNGAHASFEERIKGTLAPGMLGDVTVFETDLFAVDPGALAQVKVDLTVSGGEVVFAR